MLHKKGYTLIEIMLVLAIFSLSIIGFSVPIVKFMNQSRLDSQAQGLLHKLRTAQSNAIMNLQSSDWGVYLNDDGEFSSYTFFRGSSKDQFPSSQEEIFFPSSIRFDSIVLNNGGSEVVFHKKSGTTDDYGPPTFDFRAFNLYNTNNPNLIYSISINPIGIINLHY